MTLKRASTPAGSVLWPAALVVAVTLLAFHNTFEVPFVFDDAPSILDNPTIRSGGPWWKSFFPPHGQGVTVEGRPLLNVTLALNYAANGTAVGGYHAINLAIHAAGALVLLGLLRRTFELCRWPADPAAASFVSTAAALAWAVHPLQTESVTYVIQRAESLMGLCYLLVLYCFVRGATGPAGWRWFGLSLTAAVAGMATKEVMVTAPIMVLLYDRTFVSGSFREAWGRHRWLHVGLAATWLLLGALVLAGGNRGGTIGAAAGIAGWDYALCQSRAVIHYVGLALWPHPLVFDYGADFVSPREAAPYLVIDVMLLVATGVALWRRPPLGFVCAWFFLILAPTSSVVGGTRQMLAEHRIYLSLAAVAVFTVGGLHALFGTRARWVVGLAVAALLVATVRRNSDYRSELALYTDNVAKRPGNAFAHYNLGKALAERGHVAEAIVEDREAIRLRPQLVGAHYNLANALSETGSLDEAIAHYEAAIAAKPDYARAHYNLGNALVRAGRKVEAGRHFATAIELVPEFAEAHDNLGSVLLETGELARAEEQFRVVLRLNPNLAESRCNLGTVLLLQGKLTAAIEEFEQALRLNPGLAPARERLALARQRAAIAR